MTQDQSDPIEALIDRITEAVEPEMTRMIASDRCRRRAYMVPVSVVVGTLSFGVSRGELAPPSVNLAPNPSFERGTQHSSEVEGWAPASHFLTNAQYGWDEERARTGRRSLHVRGSIGPDGKRLSAGWVGPRCPALPGVRYTLSGWAATDTPDGNTHLTLAWYNGKNQWIGNTDNGFCVRGKLNWTELSVSGLSPEDAAFCRPYLRSDGTGGTAWLDDAKLELSGSVVGHIAVPNGSFESGIGDAVEGWTLDGSAQVSAAEGAPDGGPRCVLIEDGDGTLVSSAFCLNDVRPGLYRVGVRLNTQHMTGGAVRLALRWAGRDEVGDSADRAAVTLGRADWQQALVEVEVASGDGAARGWVEIHGQGVTGRVLIDDVTMAVRTIRLPPSTAEPIPVAVARCFIGREIPPDRLRASFADCFSGPGDAEAVMAVVRKHMTAREGKGDPALSRALRLLRYFANTDVGSGTGLAAPTPDAQVTQPPPLNVNLLHNPSFEDGLPRRNEVYDWQPAPWFAKAAYQWDEATAHSGTRSLSIRSSVADNGAATIGGWVGPLYPVFEGVRYSLRGWFSCSSSGGATRPVIAWFDEQRQFLTNTDNAFHLTGPCGWVQLSASDYPPKGAAYLRPYVRGDGCKAPVHADDLRLSVGLGRQEAVEVPNGDFETSSGTATDSWDTKGAAGIATDKSVAHSGNRCLVLRAVNGLASARTPPLRLGGDRGAVYRLVAWVNTQRVQQGHVRLAVEWQAPSGDRSLSESSPVAAHSRGWRQVSMAVEVPPCMEGASARLVVGGDNLVGSLLVDDVELEVEPAPGESIAPPSVPLGVAVARAYAEKPVPPNRLRERFATMLPREADVRRVLDEVEQHCRKHPDALDTEMQWTLGVLQHHAGRHQEAVQALFPLHSTYATTNIRNDLIWHYEHWAHTEVRRMEADKRKVDLDARMKALSATPARERARKALSLAGDYRILEFWREAATCFGVAAEHARADDVPGIAYRRAECLYEVGEAKAALDCLREAEFADGKTGLDDRPRRLMANCYVALGEGDPATEDWRAHLGTTAFPGAVYVGDDTETGPNWRGRYGGYAWILCAMVSPMDMTGGMCRPVRYDKRSGETVSGVALSRQAVGELRYAVYTGDPAEPARGYLNRAPAPEVEQEILRHPISMTPVSASWDDRGETHPYDSQGPDLCIDLDVPPGTYRLALYSKGHEIKLLSPAGKVLAWAPEGEFGGERHGYRQFVVFGPLSVTLRVVKGRSQCAKVRGIFVDRLCGPSLPPGEGASVAVPEHAEGVASLQAYRDLVAAWRTEPRAYMASLDRWASVVALTEQWLALQPDGQQEVRARWMLWQAARECGDATAAARASSAMADLLAGQSDALSAFDWLSTAAQALLEVGDVLAAEELHAQSVRLATASRDRREASGRLGTAVANYWTTDVLYAQGIAEEVVAWIRSAGKDEVSAEALRALAHRCFVANAGPPARAALLALRQDHGQGALTAEDQWRLARTYEPPCGWLDATEVDLAVREYSLLLKEYGKFPGKDRAGLRLVRLLTAEPDLPALEAAIPVLERDCPESQALLEARAAMGSAKVKHH